ncbi:luciferin 4-monooxygenase-like [Rhipicephalus sanguineus]|uniref:luciferin 4-monooxygenase-like n=1 Tax=Rhipicephalus sanguineus TaxID=34632 RepID=UPI0020C4AC74|nr:luciferin 4-monooxygenase-like [Rhipicephalus sanguineus]
MAVTIDAGVVRHRIQVMDIPEVDFGTFLWNTCEEYGNRIAVTVADGASFSYGQLREQWLRVADALEWLGFGPGQRACVHAANSSDLVLAIGGTLCAGGGIVFSKAVMTPSTLDFRQLGHVVVFGEVEGLISFTKLLINARALECRAPRGVDADTMMGAFYSSGTTGVAKRVAISHRQWIAQLLASRELAAGQIGPEDLVLCASSLTHISGLWLFCGCLTLGVPLLLLPSFDAALLVPAVRKHKVTTIMIYPSYLRSLIDNAPSEAFESVDKVFIGGSTAHVSLLHEAQDKFGFKFISQGYGLTETCGSVTSTGLRSGGFGSVGKPVPMVQLKVIDSSTGTKLGVGEKGEICVKAPFTFMGYMNKPQETAATFDDEGFVRTGDAGFYDVEGNVYVTGRLKELIKCMELQIEPAEIERLLLQDPDVQEALVLGVPHQRFGEAARAFVVLRNGRSPAGGTEGRLRRAVAEVLPNHEHLHGGIEFVDHIPKSETGKSIRSGYEGCVLSKTGYSEPVKHTQAWPMLTVYIQWNASRAKRCFYLNRNFQLAHFFPFT